MDFRRYKSPFIAIQYAVDSAILQKQTGKNITTVAETRVRICFCLFFCIQMFPSRDTYKRTTLKISGISKGNRFSGSLQTFLKLGTTTYIFNYVDFYLSFCSFYLKQKNNHFLKILDSHSPFICRSSRSQMFFKIGILKNFANFTGKHLCWSLFFNKVAGLRRLLRNLRNF